MMASLTYKNESGRGRDEGKTGMSLNSFPDKSERQVTVRAAGFESSKVGIEVDL